MKLTETKSERKVKWHNDYDANLMNIGTAAKRAFPRLSIETEAK